MSEVMYFKIMGKPHGKQRPRLAVRGARTVCYTPKSTVEYEKSIAKSYRKFCGNFAYEAGIPLSVIIRAYYPIPNSTSKKLKRKMLNLEVFPTVTPDADNIIKAILDGLNGVAYPDDKQIVEINFGSEYSKEPYVRVYLSEFKFKGTIINEII